MKEVRKAEGKLGVLCVGLGAVTTTLMTGVMNAQKGLGMLGGSVVQMAKIRCGRGKDKVYKRVKEMVSMPELTDLVFGAWDCLNVDAYESTLNAKVMLAKDVEPVRNELKAIQPMKAAFDPKFASRLVANHVKEGTRWEWTEQLREDIRRFKKENGCERVVVVWAASTEIYVPYCEEVHGSLEALEKAMKEDDCEHVAPSMCYAYAALMEDAPFVMGAPNTCLDMPAMWQLAEEKGLPIAGKDFKTGQTLMKTVLAPMFHTRCLGVQGWFSTNILGNRDGEVLDAPENFHTKEVSKLGVIDTILDAEEQPELYGDIYHKVRINYYPPRDDAKEGWDNIDIFGWMGKDYGMQIKVDFLCRDSILAAPVMFDLVMCADLAHRAGLKGTQRWMSFFLKSPMHDFTKNERPIHDLFQQFILFKNQMRLFGGYEADQELD